MKRLLRIAAVAHLLLSSGFSDAYAADPYDGNWTGSATSTGGRCRPARVTLSVEGRVVTGQARFEGDAPNIHGTVLEDGALGATIGFAALGLTARRGQANPATVPLMHSLRCSSDMMIARPRFRRQARAPGAPPYAALGLTARRGQANPATVPLMHSLRCSIIKVNGCRTTSDRSSAGFLT